MILNILLKGALFIAILFSSIVALVINDISINKLGLIPLLIIAYYYIVNKKITINKSNNLDSLIKFMLAIIVSALIGLLYIDNSIKGQSSALLNIIIQILFVYFPLILFVNNSGNTITIKKFLDFFVIILRIHAIIIFAQFIIYILTDINIIRIFFENILQGIDIQDKWNAFVFGNEKLIRASGLNYEPAFTSYLMICGFIFDKKNSFRYFYMLATILSQSRTGVVTLFAIAAWDYLYFNKKKISMKKIIFFLFCMGMIIIFITYDSKVMIYANAIFLRIIDALLGDSNEVSANIHTGYILYGVKLFVNNSSIMQLIFGYGPRISGLFFAKHVYEDNINMLMPYNRLFMPWSIECDYIDLLYGSGILGLTFYIILLIKLYKENSILLKEYSLAMLIYGFMYNCSLTTINVLVLILLTTKDMKVIWEKLNENSSNISKL